MVGGKGFAAAKRVCLVQLPVPDPNLALARANVPLAAACLKGACSRIGRDVDVQILPDSVAERGGDALVLDWVLSGGFDLVCFTLYLWNRERSGWMAARLKERMPGLLCAAGGPEVQEGRPEPDLAVFDALLRGEGEEAFFRLLGGVGRFQGCFFPPDAAGGPDAALSHPYLSRALPMGPERPVYLETMRGCPRRCSYCHYGKNSGPPRYLPLEAVEAAVTLARDSGARELYLMDPSLGARPGFEDFLAALARWNGGSMRVHAEIQLEEATPERAGLMEKAGIGSVEAGLQSANPKALKAVSRLWDRERFEAGARALTERGIEVQTGLIVGLPFDGLGEIRTSLRYVADLGLHEAAGAFPLALLPGTELRSRAPEFGMRYMEAPPYYLLSHSWLGPGEMREAMMSVETEWGREAQEPVKPRFRAESGPLDFLDLRSPSGLEALSRHAALSFSLSLLLGPPELTDRGTLLREAGRLAEAAPFTQYQLVWTAPPGALPDQVDMDIVGAAFSRPESLADRLRHYSDGPVSAGARRFFLSRDVVQALRWAEGGKPGAGEALVLDLREDPEMRFLAVDYDWEILPFLLVSPGEDLGGDLAAAYEGNEGLILAAEPDR